MKKGFGDYGIFLVVAAFLFHCSILVARTGDTLTLENGKIRLKVDPGSGAVCSFYLVETKCEMIGEKAQVEAEEHREEGEFNCG